MTDQANNNLSQQLKRLFGTTYHTTEWFVSFQKAVAGLTEAQARQQQNEESIFGIVAHLAYWNGRLLNKVKGLPQSGSMETDNEKTFAQQGAWDDLVRKAEEVFQGWTKYLEALSEKDAEHFPVIANTCMHNAYHIGQIVTLRKLQGSWNKEEGVK